MQRLFSVPKVGLFLDSYKPGMEKRRGEEVAVINLTLRVQPFDAKLATAIDDGLGDDSGVRPGLFKLSSADPKPHIKTLGFRLDCPRQRMIVFATPDSDGRFAFDQVKISGTYARDQKDVSGFAFVFNASFGPVGRDELEFIHTWYRCQKFVSFEEAEPSMAFDEDADAGEPDGLGESEPQLEMTEYGDMPNAEPYPTATDTRTSHDDDARVVPKRGNGKGRKKHDPAAERAAQRAEGVKKAKANKRKSRIDPDVVAATADAPLRDDGDFDTTH